MRGFKNKAVAKLIRLAKAGEIEQYEELVKKIKKEQPATFKRLSDTAYLHEPWIDQIWMIYNAPPGGTDEEVSELVERMKLVE